MRAPSRRVVLAGATGLLLSGAGRAHRALGATLAGAAAATRPAAGPQSLWLKRPDGSEVATRFRTEAGYDRLEVLRLSWFMRDLADGDHAVWMEPRLFDLLAGVQAGLAAAAGAPVPLVVTSGYRTAAHNARIETAARNSMHLYGYAADLKAPGFDPRAVALAASFFNHGGIGLYDSFTHLDVWKARVWSGPPRRGAAPGDAAPPLAKTG